MSLRVMHCFTLFYKFLSFVLTSPSPLPSSSVGGAGCHWNETLVSDTVAGYHKINIPVYWARASLQLH